jgi:hypothetical protein
MAEFLETIGAAGGGIDSFVYFLLHCDGANNSTAFPDAGPGSRAMTVAGNTKVSTTQAKFGGASAYFDGTSDWITPGTVSIGTSAFTFDCWIYLSSYTSSRHIFSLGGSNVAATAGFSLVVPSTGLLSFGASGSVQGAGTTTVSLNTWHHVALVGNGGAYGSRTYKGYLDGVLQFTVSANYSISASCYVGTNGSSTSSSFLGWLDEVRLSIGIERWTDAFIPPADAYAA